MTCNTCGTSRFLILENRAVTCETATDPARYGPDRTGSIAIEGHDSGAWASLVTAVALARGSTHVDHEAHGERAAAIIGPGSRLRPIRVIAETLGYVD